MAEVQAFVGIVDPELETAAREFLALVDPAEILGGLRLFQDRRVDDLILTDPAPELIGAGWPTTDAGAVVRFLNRTRDSPGPRGRKSGSGRRVGRVARGTWHILAGQARFLGSPGELRRSRTAEVDLRRLAVRWERRPALRHRSGRAPSSRPGARREAEAHHEQPLQRVVGA